MSQNIMKVAKNGLKFLQFQHKHNFKLCTTNPFLWQCRQFSDSDDQPKEHTNVLESSNKNINVSSSLGTATNLQGTEKKLEINFERNFEDKLFDLLVPSGDDTLFLSTLISRLAETGLQEDDPRLSVLFQNARMKAKDQGVSLTTKIFDLELDRESFKICVKDCLSLVRKSLSGDFVIPEFQDFVTAIDRLYWEAQAVKQGRTASYIPQLSRYSVNHWGLALCTVDGQRHARGHHTIPFSLQSCSKPLVYALTVEEMGVDMVHQFVGMEPSGEQFNRLKLDQYGKPHNPMVNAGAILVMSLLKNNLRLAERFDYIQTQFRRLAGKDFVGFNNSIFLSERDTADRNFALSYYMKEHQSCSIEVSCDSASVMAATLANGGICPLTGEQILSPATICSTLSLMYSCGMYDYSGQFAFYVGLPCKSGVSGAVLLVVPNVMGMCLWSPALDSYGNSVRGLHFCKELVQQFNFHTYDNLVSTKSKHDPRTWRDEVPLKRNLLALFAAQKGDLGALHRVHLQYDICSIVDYEGRTPLHLAAAEGHLDCVRFLAECCELNVDAKDRDNQTPLDEAEKYGHPRVVEYFQKLKKHSKTPTDNFSNFKED